MSYYISSKRCQERTERFERKAKIFWEQRSQAEDWNKTFDAAEFIGRLIKHLKAPKNNYEYLVYYCLFCLAMGALVKAHDVVDDEKTKEDKLQSTWPKKAIYIPVASFRSLFVPLSGETLKKSVQENELEQTPLSTLEQTPLSTKDEHEFIKLLLKTDQKLSGHHKQALSLAWQIRKYPFENLDNSNRDEDNLAQYRKVIEFNVKILKNNLLEELDNQVDFGDFLSDEILKEYNNIAKYLLDLQGILIKAQLAEKFHGGGCEGRTAIAAMAALKKGLGFEYVYLKHPKNLGHHLFLVMARNKNKPLTSAKDLESGVVLDYCSPRNALKEPHGKFLPEVITAAEIKQFPEVHEIYSRDYWTWKSKFISSTVPKSLKGKHFSKSGGLQNLSEYAQKKVTEMLEKGIHLIKDSY